MRYVDARRKRVLPCPIAVALIPPHTEFTSTITLENSPKNETSRRSLGEHDFGCSSLKCKNALRSTVLTLAASVTMLHFVRQIKNKKAKVTHSSSCSILVESVRDLSRAQ